MSLRVKLSDLRVNQFGVITRLPEGMPSLTRLREMGLLPGTKLQFIRRAPMGDPLEFNVRGALISLRTTEAAMIEVELQP